jgi:hypothetical protein
MFVKVIDKMYKLIKGFIPATVSVEQAKDTGMAMVLICLLIAVMSGRRQFELIAIILLLINMVRPVIYRPLAKIWFGFSNLLGTLMSKVILTIIFFILVVPIGLIRRLMGKDSLRLKEWKKGSNSVFRIRDHKFISDDIINPY